jgi:hypothetical protein
LFSPFFWKPYPFGGGDDSPASGLFRSELAGDPAFELARKGGI